MKINNYVVADCFDDVKLQYETAYFPMMMLGENVTPETSDDDNPIRKRREVKESK